jgi:RNA polymerase sigma-70 factor (ECF subfamily)
MDPVQALLARARAGDQRALADLFDAFRERLVRMVELRLDTRLRRRLDPADVVQEAWLEVARRFPEWAEADSMPWHVWLRLTTAQALVHAQRRHFGVHLRDPRFEASRPGSRPSVTAAQAADALVDSATTPTQAARRSELRARVLEALESLDEIDREVVVLRHYEGLSNAEAAAELSIETAAASKRFTRALLRLQPALQALASDVSAEGR